MVFSSKIGAGEHWVLDDFCSCRTEPTSPNLGQPSLACSYAATGNVKDCETRSTIMRSLTRSNPVLIMYMEAAF